MRAEHEGLGRVQPQPERGERGLEVREGPLQVRRRTPQDAIVEVPRRPDGGVPGAPVRDGTVDPKGKKDRPQGVALLDPLPGEERGGVGDKERGGSAVCSQEPWGEGWEEPVDAREDTLPGNGVEGVGEVHSKQVFWRQGKWGDGMHEAVDDVKCVRACLGQPNAFLEGKKGRCYRRKEKLLKSFRGEAAKGFADGNGAYAS